MKRQIQISAVAAMFDAAKKLDTKSEHVQALSQQGFGRFGVSTIVRPAVNTKSAEISPGLCPFCLSLRLAQGTDCVINLGRRRSERWRHRRPCRARQEWSCP